MPPRYAIEATCLVEPAPTGIGRYTRNLLRALDDLPPADGAFELVQLYRSSRLRQRHRLEQGPRLSRQMWRDSVWPLRHDYQLVHATDYRLPPWSKPAKIATIHDIYPLLGINFQNSADRARQIRIYRDLVRRCDRIILVSEHSRRDFLAHFEFDERCAHVTHLGVDDRFRPRPADEVRPILQKYGIAEPYLLFTGWATPNKNLLRLLEAYAHSRALRQMRLIVTGRADAEQIAKLREAAARNRIEDRVNFPGYIDDADLPALFAGAAAYLFPSLYEGFGLPILEAMASGTPVLTSTTGSCPEVANGHAVLVDPNSVEDIAHGIERTVQMTAPQRDAARRYALTKTWRSTAEETLKVYRLGKGPGKGPGSIS